MRDPLTSGVPKAIGLRRERFKVAERARGFAFKLPLAEAIPKVRRALARGLHVVGVAVDGGDAPEAIGDELRV